jgi:hypothetical protein
VEAVCRLPDQVGRTALIGGGDRERVIPLGHADHLGRVEPHTEHRAEDGDRIGGDRLVRREAEMADPRVVVAPGDEGDAADDDGGKAAPREAAGEIFAPEVHRAVPRRRRQLLHRHLDAPPHRAVRTVAPGDVSRLDEMALARARLDKLGHRAVGLDPQPGEGPALTQVDQVMPAHGVAQLLGQLRAGDPLVAFHRHAPVVGHRMRRAARGHEDGRVVEALAPLQTARMVGGHAVLADQLRQPQPAQQLHAAAGQKVQARMARSGHRAFDDYRPDIVMCQFQSENCTHRPGSHHEYLGTQCWRSQEAHPLSQSRLRRPMQCLGMAADYGITCLRYYCPSSRNSQASAARLLTPSFVNILRR